MRVVDSSCAVAAFAGWHPAHVGAGQALSAREVGIVAHAAVETYSVLTRLPEPHAMSPDVVWQWLDDTFGERWLGLTSAALRHALARLERLGIAGGRTYDGLIGITAAASDATLVTLDRRALATYALVGADVELVAE